MVIDKTTEIGDNESPKNYWIARMTKKINFLQPTEAERAERLEKAKRTLSDRKSAAEHYQTPNPGDYAHWQGLASKFGVRMPAWHTPVNKKYMARYARRLGYTIKDCRRIFGIGWEFEDFAKLCPNKSIQYFFGALLEHKNGQ